MVSGRPLSFSLWHPIDVIEFEFFQHLNQFYGVIAEVCTNRNCPRYDIPRLLSSQANL